MTKQKCLGLLIVCMMLLFCGVAISGSLSQHNIKSHSINPNESIAWKCCDPPPCGPDPLPPCWPPPPPDGGSR